jgi:dimethylargininase
MVRTAFRALTRAVSASIGRCELTHLARTRIDVGRAAAQHRAYERTLAALGCRVTRLPPEPDLPDAVFVEDTAVVLDDVAVIARPGAPARRAETASVAPALATCREIATVEAPATLDGGDVLVVGRKVFVGRSTRTNRKGFEALQAVLGPRGYTVLPVEIGPCLHLKSAVTRVGEDRLLVNTDWVDAGVFRDFELIAVHPEEPAAANALRLATAVVLPEAHPRTRQRLERAGIEVVPVEVSELAKAEGAVTCCSLVFKA